MSIKCCSCNKDLGDSQMYLLPDKTLNTMCKRCRYLGLGKDIGEELSSLERLISSLNINHNYNRIDR